MKIDYKILWIDDQIEVFKEDGYIDEINLFLKSFGLNPIVTYINNKEKFIKNLNDTYDLILTDFNIDSHTNGKDIIEEVRGNNIFTEILFYTAKGNLEDTFKKDRITFFQTSNNHYKEVVDKIKSLIELTLKKFNDIVIMRGMIMNEVSYMDEVKLDIIKQFINSSEEDIKKSLPNIKMDILKIIKDNFNSKIKDIEKWGKNEDGFGQLIKDNFVFSSFYKIKTISHILDTLKLDNFANDYKKDIIQMRNKFAHVALKEEDGKKYFKSNTDDNIFDDTLCKKIREDIIKYKQCLFNTLDKITKNQKEPHEL